MKNTDLYYELDDDLNATLAGRELNIVLEDELSGNLIPPLLNELWKKLKDDLRFELYVDFDDEIEFELIRLFQ